MPGLGSSLVVYALGLLDEPVDVYMWDGYIPQFPKPLFNYPLTFNIAGLTNEYAEPAVFLMEKYLVIVRVKALGKKDGRKADATVELIDYYDEQTGFAAMERSTGWSGAIVAEMMAEGQTPRGAGGVESFIPAAEFVEALRQRGIHISESLVMH